MKDPIVAGYDAVHARSASRTLRRIWREQVLGPEYPDGYEHLGFLTFPELRRMAANLALSGHGALVDLGCGAGGPGLWIVNESKGRLVGIDASKAALMNAAARARDLGLTSTSGFVRARFEDLALRTESAEAVMSVDALQYGTNKHQMFAEIARILPAGGRLVFTAFEIDPTTVARLPVLRDDPVADFRPALEAAGFEVETYDESDGWKERVTKTYQAVRAALPRLLLELGPFGAAAIASEVTLALQRQMYRRRVFVAAVRRR
jgi:ubiquinone/menaquinone biosynthesis C-methylase UbiE